MRSRGYPGSFELMVMLALIRLGGEAYGVPIRRELESRSGREVLIGSVYAALDRLEVKKLVRSRVGEPTPQRGGRAKKYFEVTPQGMKVVREARETFMSLWKDLPALTGERA